MMLIMTNDHDGWLKMKCKNARIYFFYSEHLIRFPLQIYTALKGILATFIYKEKKKCFFLYFFPFFSFQINIALQGILAALVFKEKKSLLAELCNSDCIIF